LEVLTFLFTRSCTRMRAASAQFIGLLKEAARAITVMDCISFLGAKSELREL